MLLGVAYYPEHWPQERWPADAGLMQEAGINTVRMGEFAWSRLEPAEGRYEFGWLEKAIGIFRDRGIETMLCTCSRTPPPWVFGKYPEIRNTNREGSSVNYGGRYSVNLLHPRFVELSHAIDEAVIRHFIHFSGVSCWQIDNEVGAGNADFSDLSLQMFHLYLEGKYGSVEELNKAWGSHFWSFHFSDFKEVPLPIGNPSVNPHLALEYSRFLSQVNVDFAIWRYDLIKKLRPDIPVTTNFQTERETHTDIFQLGRATDFYGTNFYAPLSREFSLDYCRGSKGRFVVLEQQSGEIYFKHSMPPGEMRKRAWHSIAHGASGVNFFRWRSCRWGQEQFWAGILGHSGHPGGRFEELKTLGREFEACSRTIQGTRPHGVVAVLMSFESRWAFDAAVTWNDDLNVEQAAYRYHEALMSSNITVDALDPREELTRYRLVIAPRLYVVDDAVQRNLKAYVASGGVLCLTPMSGMCDEYGKVFEIPQPGPLTEFMGMAVSEYTPLAHAVALRAADKSLRKLRKGVRFAEAIEPHGAAVLARYADGALKGKAAVTANRYGEGFAIYCGTVLESDDLDHFVGYLLNRCEAAAPFSVPDRIQILERAAADRRIVFVFNHGNTSKRMRVGEGWEDVLRNAPVRRFKLPPNDLAILRSTMHGMPPPH